MYSPSLSDLMDLILFPKLFSIKDFRTLNILNTSDFCFIKYTQQNLEQSSIKARKYLEPLFDVIGIGPETSLCIRSSVEAALCTFPTSYLFSRWLPTKQTEHTPSEVWMGGKPSTILSLWSCWRYLKLNCPNLSCHILLVLLACFNRSIGGELC